MPEYPDITLYIERLGALLTGEVLEQVRLKSAFLLRSVEPPLSAAFGAKVRGFARLGKRIVFELSPAKGAGDIFLVLHLMVAGRLRWRKRGVGLPAKAGLAAFDFGNGTLLLSENSKKKRASLHVVGSPEELKWHDPGGIDFMTADHDTFAAALTRENHTLKRALTDPRLFSGIGNAYSDEILHRARLSPVRLSQKLAPDEIERLRLATTEVMTEWTERLRAEIDPFPEKVTAFHEAMAAHGRYGKPCPTCGAPIQRIRYAENETNYCAPCQTEGKLLKDRAISRLLKKDWPRTLDELEGLKSAMREKIGK